MAELNFPGEAAERSLYIRRVADWGNTNFVWVLLAIVVIGATIANPVFISKQNLFNILIAIAPLACLVLAQGVVLITGHMDLTTEANMVFVGVVGGVMLEPTSARAYGSPALGVPWPWVIPSMLALGAFIGLVNGVMVAKLRMNPFMTTLGGLVALGGLALVVGHGLRVIYISPSFRYMGSATLGRFPISALVVGAAFLGIGLMLSKTVLGRYIYAVGSNRTAARAAGVPDQNVVMVAYVISGLLCGLAAFLLVGQLGTASPEISSGNLFISIAAAVLGGVSLFGGKGSAIGMLGGLLVMGSIFNALNLADISSFWVDVVIGGIILLAIFIDGLRVRLSEGG